jgi:Domain of unknown function (DUF4157)
LAVIDEETEETPMFAPKSTKPPTKAAEASIDRLPNRSTRRGQRLDGRDRVEQVVEEAVSTPGQPLDPAVRSMFEIRFGHDLSSVRIHTDPRAAASASTLGARAYTYGSDIAFAAGNYAPNTMAGRRLLSHELAHISQQRNAWRGDGDEKTGAGNSAELEAQAEAVARSSPTATPLRFTLGSVSTPVVLCQKAADTAEAPSPSPTDAPAERTQSVSAEIAILNEAKRVALAQPPDEARALAILDDALRFFRRIGDNLNVTKRLQAHGGVNITYATGLIGRAIGAVDALAGRIRIGQHPSAATWDFELRNVEIGKEYLQIAAGDIEAGESKLVAGVEEAFDWTLEITRTAIELTPIIGSIIMVGEAVGGWSITGKRLSTAERALLGAGALLAEVGSLIKAGQATVAATRLSTVAGLSMQDSLRLVMVSRVLTDAERATLAELALKVSKGAQLTEKEQVFVNRLMGKLNEAGKALAVRGELAKDTGTATQAGRFTNLDNEAKASEKAIGQALATHLNADVVKLPRAAAVKGAEAAATPGAKDADFLINNLTAEFRELETTAMTAEGKPKIATALSKIENKHKQAGIIIVDPTKSVVRAADLLGSMGRLWGRPTFADVKRVIIVSGTQILAIVDRPVSALDVLLPPAIKGGAKAAEAHAGEKKNVQPEAAPP